MPITVGSRFSASVWSPIVFGSGHHGTFLVRHGLPYRTHYRTKSSQSSTSIAGSQLDLLGPSRSRRMKARKSSGFCRMDLTRKKVPNYTDMAYREAVFKLKYLLAESYASKANIGKVPFRHVYKQTESRADESGDDIDDRSVLSDNSKKCIVDKSLQFRRFLPRTNNSTLTNIPNSNMALTPVTGTNGNACSAPPELASFIERQEEYIEQLERESQYCRDELKNLLVKVREVILENEALQEKSKNGFLNSVVEEYRNADDEVQPKSDELYPSFSDSKEPKTRRKPNLRKVLEGPSIIFESRISELEAQLTQARLELKKSREENQETSKKLAECSRHEGPEYRVQLERVIRDKRDVEMKLEELQRNLLIAREGEAECIVKAKRAADAARDAEFEKAHAEAEVRRLKEELERRNEKIRETSQDVSRRLVEEKQQVERRFSQQVEQLSADVATHWDAASKSQMESEKQKKEILELRRELMQKQTFVDDLRKELQNKLTIMHNDLNRAMAEKEEAVQELSNATERAERQSKQEQSRLQAEINSYKLRLERADADLVHCRRENIRLMEQIASIEKEMNIKLQAEEALALLPTPRVENDKDLTSMVVDAENKTAAMVLGLEGALNDQASQVSRLKAHCQSLTQRLEANDQRHKQEMANLQSNIEHLSSRIQDTYGQRRLKGDTMSSKNEVDEPDFETHFQPKESNKCRYSSRDIIREGLDQAIAEQLDDDRQVDYSMSNIDHNGSNPQSTKWKSSDGPCNSQSSIYSLEGKRTNQF